MRATALFSVWFLVTAVPAVAGGHASGAGSFQAPASTMSDTSPAVNPPRVAGRGASWKDFSKSPAQRRSQQAFGANGSSGNNTSGNGAAASGGSGNTTYKANAPAQKTISESGAKTTAALAKMGTEAVTAATAQTDSFLKGLANMPRPNENFESLGPLAGRVDSTAGSGSSGAGFDALINEKNQLFKTGENILMQIGARQLATQPPPQAVPTAPRVPIYDRISAALANGRRQSGNGLNYVPPGMEVGESTDLR